MIGKFPLGLGLTLSLAIQAMPVTAADGYPNRPVELVVPYPAGE